MHFTGINYAEILSRKGLYGWAIKRPYILGMEGSGIIESVGAGVDGSRIGQKVMVGTQNGCYAEKVVIPQVRAIPEISHFTMEENAAFLVNYMTAWVSLFSLATLEPEEKVLITAAAGGVGTAAIQLASKLGCEVYGLAGSREKIEYLLSIGATGAFNYREEDCFEKLRETSGGIDVILEMVGGKVYKESFTLLNPLGRLVVAGFAGLDLKKWNPFSWWSTWRDIPRVNLMKLAQTSAAVMSSHLGYLLRNPQLMQTVFEDLKQFVVKNDIRPVVGKVFQFEQVSEAHAFIESRKSIGKVLLQHTLDE
jgi:NADPH2:quinone reductase